jgi:hypothetical protein
MAISEFDPKIRLEKTKKAIKILRTAWNLSKVRNEYNDSL